MAGAVPRETKFWRTHWLRSRKLRTPALLLAPGVLLFITFVFYPILASLTLAFYDWPGAGAKTWVGLGNYRELFSDPVFYTALGNNILWLALIVIAPVLGLGLALLISEARRGFRLLRSVFFLPFVISQVVIGMIFAWFFDAHFGLLNQILAYMTIDPVAPLASERWAIFAIIAAGLWPQTAYCMMLYLAGLTLVSPVVVEAARLDGAHGWRLLWHIVIPQLWPVHFIVAMVSVITALRSFDLVMVMTRGGPYDSSMVLALYMYEQAFSNSRYGYGAAIASVLFVMTAGCMSLFLWQMLRRERH